VSNTETIQVIPQQIESFQEVKMLNGSLGTYQFFEFEQSQTIDQSRWLER
jgi:hypothetical protein